MPITKNKRITFKTGGIHPGEGKDITQSLPLVASEPPKILEVLMLQHLGAPAKPVVEKRQEVKKGQIIGEAQGFISANVHSPVSGKVKVIENKVHNPTGRAVPAIIIANDGQEEWAEGCNQEQDLSAMNAEAMVSAVQRAGVVGMGGATFPAHVKLSPPKETPVTDVMINGAECEPILTCDHRLMLEKTQEIVEALSLIMHIVGAENGYVGIEANKPDAINAFKQAVEASEHDMNIRVLSLETKYPQGAEQQLITAISGREVPAGGGLPSHVGCLVHNVATALAILDAVKFSRPLIERPLTVAGDAILNPGNFIERIGTPIEHILERQGVKEDMRMLISGGPMMGVAQGQTDVPLIKGNSGILAFTQSLHKEQRSCIRCGRCVDACPLNLMPNMISVLCENEEWEEAQNEYGVKECKECGCCAYICPAKREIVHMIKWCKAELSLLES